MRRRPRFYLIMAIAVTAAYGLQYFNGVRYGFTRLWFAGAFLGTPFLFIVWAMYRPDRPCGSYPVMQFLYLSKTSWGRRESGGGFPSSDALIQGASAAAKPEG